MLFDQQPDVSPVSFIDECEICELAAVIESLEVECEVLFGELFESSLCFIAFVAVSSEVVGLPRGVFLEAAASFFLPSDFEPDRVERVFAFAALFSELFLFVLDRCACHSGPAPGEEGRRHPALHRRPDGTHRGGGGPHPGGGEYN